MLRKDQQGSLLIPLIITGSLLLFSIVFGLWAFMGRQDYKNNTDAKITEAVEAAEDQLVIEKDAEFAEREKSPFVSYQGPSAFGTLGLSYPKTWSVYVDERGTGSTPLKGYMHPRRVPYEESDTIFAFRFEVLETAYDQVLKSYDGNVKAGKVSVSAYRAPKVETVLGARVQGEISSKKQGDIVLLPLRDKTIKLWTEGNEYRADFEEILKNLTFIP